MSAIISHSRTPLTDAEGIRFARIMIEWPQGKPKTTELIPADFARELEEALCESLNLQSHYAELLNMDDGGKRMTFTVNSWLARLNSLKVCEHGKRLTEYCAPCGRIHNI